MSDSAFFWRTFFVLSGLTIMGPLALDSFLPAMGDLATGVNADMGSVLITLSMIQIGNATGQIIYGPLSDRFGRRPIILFGMGLYVCAAAGSIFITSIEPLFVLRFLQGSAIASTMIILRAVVRDLFNVHDGARMYAYLYMTLAAMPLFGPIIGGYLTETFGWRSVFIFMTCVSGIVLLALIAFLKESLSEKDHRAMTPSVLAISFAEIIRDRTFVAFLLCGMGNYGALFAVLAGLAPVMVGFMGETPTVFGFQFSAIMLAHFIAALFAGKLLRAMGIKKILLLSGSLCTIGGVSLFGFAIFDIATRETILIPTGVFMIGFAFFMSPMTAGALSNFPHMAGRAASLLGFLQQGFAAVITFTLGVFENGTQMPMVLALSTCSVLGFIAYLTLVRTAPLREEAPVP
jgi:DHA1 family bicyclomycin/chloramphenicol resistance-like MFS transporter